LFKNNNLRVGISARGGLEPGFRVPFSTIFHGNALEKRYSGRKHWKAVEAKPLQTAASLRTFFVFVISAEALKSLVAFLGYSRARDARIPNFRSMRYSTFSTAAKMAEAAIGAAGLLCA
jgi:hypothetical protein